MKSAVREKQFKDLVDILWGEYDKEDKGYLTKKEARKFFKDMVYVCKKEFNQVVF